MRNRDTAPFLEPIGPNHVMRLVRERKEKIRTCALEITHVPAGLRLEPAKIRLPTPKEASSFEVRRVTLKLSADKKLSPGTRMIEAKLTYYVCEGDPLSGRCYRKKKSFKLPVLVGAFSAAPPAAGLAYKALKDFEHVRLEAGPAEVKAGASAVLALRFSLRKEAGKALRWNNLAFSRLTLKPARGLSVPQRKLELPRPGDEPSNEPRRITIRYAAEKSLAPGPYPIAARLTYYVTNVETGASFRRKEKFTLTVHVTKHPETPAKE